MIFGEDEVALAKQYLSHDAVYCIQCGRPIGESENYIRGHMCGRSNACMCLECSKGDGASCLEGTYGEQFQAWRQSHPVKDVQKKKPISISDFLDWFFAILCPVLLVAVIMLYIVDMFY